MISSNEKAARKLKTAAKRALTTIVGNVPAMVSRPYSRLLIHSDGADWSLDADAKDILNTARSLGIRGAIVPRPLPFLQQCVHYTSHFALANPTVFKSRHRISVDYFHGKPEQGAEFARIHEAIRKNHRQMGRIRVSYSEMERVALSTGIAPDKVVRIPIGINPEFFSFQTPESRKSIRTRLEIPQSAVVIGSFQKDGQGWGEGLEPKLIKGPDTFLEAIRILKDRIPELFVLLTGPSRGYVKNGLTRLGVPFQHHLLKSWQDVGRYYQALDAYLISSREEGGPKAVLESMISGIPLVSTRVGQAIDLIQNGENGFLVPTENSEALASEAYKYLTLSEQDRQRLLQKGFQTATFQTYTEQKPLWKKFFYGFIELDELNHQ